MYFTFLCVFSKAVVTESSSSTSSDASPPPSIPTSASTMITEASPWGPLLLTKPAAPSDVDSLEGLYRTLIVKGKVTENDADESDVDDMKMEGDQRYDEE